MDIEHLSSSQFAEEIEKIAATNGGDYVDAILSFCSDKGLEPETAASLVKLNQKLKKKLKASAHILNFMKPEPETDGAV